MTIYTAQEQFTAKKITAVVYNDEDQRLDVTMADASVGTIRLDMGFITWTGPLIGKNYVMDENNRLRILSDDELAEDFSEVS